MEFCVVELLEPIDTCLIDGVLVPLDFREEAIQAGLIGGIGHFGGHSGDVFVVGDHQASQVIGEMFSLRIVFEQRCEKLIDRVLHDFRGRNDRHGLPFPVTGNILRRSPDHSKNQLYAPIIDPLKNFDLYGGMDAFLKHEFS
jgi:hypothetical protein